MSTTGVPSMASMGPMRNRVPAISLRSRDGGPAGWAGPASGWRTLRLEGRAGELPAFGAQGPRGHHDAQQDERGHDLGRGVSD